MKHHLVAFSMTLMCIQCHDTVHPSASADTIAFVNRDNSINHIYLMEIDPAGHGSQARRLTSDVETEDYPSWSPNGKMLAYHRGKDGTGIYLIHADGTNQQRLSPVPGFDVNPSWSPDGKQIIYVRVLDLIQPNIVPRTEIRIVNLDGSGDHVILPGTDFSVEPRWSVKNKIVFMGLRNGSMHILTMDVDGAHLQQLTQEGNNGDPAWSPDGTKISFGSDREGSNKLNIYVIDEDGGNVRQLTHLVVPYEAGDTNWSSDGTRIAFEYDVDGKKQSDPEAYAEVWTIDAIGSKAQSTTFKCSGVGCAPRWKPIQ